jgi:CDP-2,3-bis-(O-geranylgeranyl)-sn-glycerol synthase
LFKYGFVKELNLIGYTFYNSVLIGFLLGFGALLGDSIKSFFKRQLSIKPGRPFPVFDQIDYVLGSLLLVLTSVNLSWQIIVIILLISPLLPIIANIIAYSLKLKKVWW